MMHMKSILKIIVLLLLPVIANAQNSVKERDSLLKALRSASNDTIRMDINRKLGFYYQDVESKLALPYHQTQLKLAKKLNLKLYEADAYQQIGYCNNINLDMAEAYKNFLIAFKVAEDPKCAANGWGYSNFSYSKSPEEARQSIIGMLHYEMTGLYDGTSSKKELKYHLFEALKIGKKLNNKKIMTLATRNIGNLYYRENKPDSGFMYYQKALKLYKNSPFQKHLDVIYLKIARHYRDKKEYDSATFYFRKALKQGNQPSTYIGFGQTNRSFGVMFKETGQLDSAKVYTLKGLKISDSINDYGGIADGYKKLSDIYKLKNDNAQAYYYLIKANKINDSITAKYIEGLNNFQNADFNQKIRLQELAQESEQIKSRNTMYALLTWVGIFLIVALLLYRNNRQKQKANQVLENTLSALKSTQTQLIQSEKMASLGELTAGIAHEIQNPLNFVNNFSEVNIELIEELRDELEKGNADEVKALLNDIEDNEKKINHHGKRADAIVKGMLQHSRSGSVTKEPTDINKLADEYLRLAYHGLRAKDKSFNAELVTNFSPSLPKVNVLTQEIGRVVLNLFTNAFYATHQMQKQSGADYKPVVSITTAQIDNYIEIKVKDNGIGIPDAIKDKILQPFFTTKPTGEGTGLGLSLSYDIIVKSHNGKILIDSKEKEYTIFTIQIPID
jgi:two-component system, NtrC family, sensor kinase